MIKYPAAIDTQIELPYVVDNSTPISGELINNLRDAVVAMETELGIKPSGIYSNVRSRISALETSVGNLVLSGGTTFGGDLTAVTPIAQKVIGLQGNSVAATAPTDGYLLTWNQLALEWQPLAPPVSFTAGGDLSGSNTNQTVIALRGRSVSNTAPNSGDTLLWSGSAWTPGPSFTPGGDLTGNTSSQTVVSLTGSLGIVSVPTAVLAFGADPATSGVIRMTAAVSTDLIKFKYSGADYNLAQIDGSAFLRIGNTSFNQQIDSYGLVLNAQSSTLSGVVNSTEVFQLGKSSANDHISFGTVPAATGTLRLSKANTIKIRDDGDTSDLPVFSYNAAGGIFTFGDISGIAHSTIVNGNSAAYLGSSAGGTYWIGNGAAPELSGYVSSTKILQLGKTANDYIDFGASPATTGALRLANAMSLQVRNATDDGDLPLVTSSGNNFTIGHQNLVAALGLYANSSFLWGTSNSGIYNTSGSGYAIYVDGSHTDLANNIGLLGGQASSTFGSGTGVLYQGNASVAPTANATNGYLQYAKSGNAYVRSSSGVVQSVNGTRVVVNISDANYTAVQNDYEANIIEVTGTLTANREFILPAINGYRWNVYNNTTGGYYLTFKVSGQTGVIVANTERALLYSNGTDIAAISFGGGANTVPPLEMSFVSGVYSTTSITFQRMGGRSIDLSLWPRNRNGLTRRIDFVADINKTSGATSVEIQLYDITNEALITSTNLTSTNNTTTRVSATNLTVGTSAGNLRTDTIAQYEIQLKMNGGGGSDAVFVTNARLLVTYV